MKELQKIKNITKDGITLYLVKRIGEKALVINYTEKYFQGYEVHIIRKQKAKDITLGGNKVHIEEAEHYRTAKEFGRHAWAYPNLVEVYKAHPEFNEFNAEIVVFSNDVRLNAGKTKNTLHEGQTNSGIDKI